MRKAKKATRATRATRAKTALLIAKSAHTDCFPSSSLSLSRECKFQLKLRHNGEPLVSGEPTVTVDCDLDLEPVASA